MINYYDIKAISQSQVRDYMVSAYDFWKHSPYNPNHIPNKKSKCMDFGSLAHGLVLERENFNNKFFVSNYDNFLSKVAKEEKSAKEDEGLIVISNSDFEKASNMAMAIANHREANLLLQDSICEKELYSVYNVDEYRTIDIKGKIDCFKKSKEGDVVIIDYKTTSNIETFIRSASYERYYIQPAMYKKLIKINYPEINNVYFKYIVQSTVEGEEDKILIVSYDHEFIEYADQKLHGMLYEIKDHLDEYERGNTKVWDYKYKGMSEFEIPLPNFINN